MAKKVDATGGVQQLVISAPNFQVAEFAITGNAPYVQNRFSAKAMQTIRDTQEAGQQAKKGKKREPKDFRANYEGAKHVSTEGWLGIPASAFRAAMISACKNAGYFMSRAKLSLFVIADGFDAVDGTPLVKINGEPHYSEHYARNDNGSVDLRARPMWDAGWTAAVRVRFDADQFSLTDVANLMHRVGVTVGIGEGRPDSKNSQGMGWGTFDLEGGAA